MRAQVFSWVHVAAAVLVAVVGLVAAPVARAQDSCVPPRTLGVAFALDDSGSMADSDPSELRIEATRAGIDQMPDSSIVAVSSFDSSARTQVDPTVLTAANREAVKQEVWGAASGNTEYELGFRTAKAQLDAMPTADKRALVFLSDGVPTSSYSTDRVLAAAGIPIFTIGFGDAPPAQLAGIAARSGGQAFVVRSVGEAQAVFARIVSTLICDAQKYTTSVALAPGETKTVPFTVEPSFREFRALAAWEYGDVTVRVNRPDASVLGPGALLAGESFVERPDVRVDQRGQPGRGRVVGLLDRLGGEHRRRRRVDRRLAAHRLRSAGPAGARRSRAGCDGERRRRLLLDGRARRDQLRPLHRRRRGEDRHRRDEHDLGRHRARRDLGVVRGRAQRLRVDGLREAVREHQRRDGDGHRRLGRRRLRAALRPSAGRISR